MRAIHLRHIRTIDTVTPIVHTARNRSILRVRTRPLLTLYLRRGFAILVASAFTLAIAPTYLFPQSERDSSGAYVGVGVDRVHSSATVLSLHNGLNRIDLLGTGQTGEIIVSRRGNGNAHGYSIVMFQVLARAASDGSNRRAWQVIPFFGGPHDSESGRSCSGRAKVPTVRFATCASSAAATGVP